MITRKNPPDTVGENYSNNE